jgi:hypothetical protein
MAQTSRRNASASLAGCSGQISCVEGRRSITMRELKVQIGNSGLRVNGSFLPGKY